MKYFPQCGGCTFTSIKSKNTFWRHCKRQLFAFLLSERLVYLFAHLKAQFLGGKGGKKKPFPNISSGHLLCAPVCHCEYFRFISLAVSDVCRSTMPSTAVCLSKFKKMQSKTQPAEIGKEKLLAWHPDILCLDIISIWRRQVSTFSWLIQFSWLSS